MTRRLATFVAVLTLVASLLGVAAPVAAATPTAGRTSADITSPSRDTVAVNAPPVAVDDPAIPGCFTGEFGGSFPIPEDWPQLAFLSECAATANDSDDGTVASWHVDTLPAHGALEWAQSVPGVFGYTPDPNWSTLPGNVGGGDWVSDSFTYHVVDDQGASSNEATYRFWISPVNDAPTFTPGPAFVVVRGSAPHSASWATAVSPGPNEDSQAVHFEITSIDLNGTVGLFSAGPAISPAGTLSFTPAAGKVGTATVTVDAKDDGGLESYQGPPVFPRDTSDPVTFDIVVQANGSPDAADDSPSAIDEDAGATTIDVLANDSDPDLDTLMITDVADGTLGTVAITGGGTGLAYTPNLNANGSDSFTYTIDDGHGGTDSATVSVTIDPLDDAPVAGIDVVTVTEDQTTASPVFVLANDTDAEGDPLTVSAKTNGAKGVVAIATDGGSMTYKPNANAFGSDSFTYTASDGQGGFTIGTVNVTIIASNDPPNAVNDGVPSPVKVYLLAGAKAIAVFANDTFLPDAPETLRITKVTQGSHGKVTITGSGTGLTYTPTGTTTGIDVFKYTISDGHGGTDTASVQVIVARDTTAPKATITGLTNTAITGSTKRRLTVTWAFAETQSGIRSEQLQRRTDSGSWVTVTLSASSIRSASFSFFRGHTYAFRVRATDRSGNVGLFVGRSLRI